MFKQILRITSLLVFSVSVSASYIQISPNIQDHGIFTRDLATGLDWLDVTESRGLSYNQVTSQMGEGQLFHGWRYATAAEFDQLIINFGYVAVGNEECRYLSLHCDINIAGDSEKIEEMIWTLGDTRDAHYDEVNSRLDFSATGAGWTWGILGTRYRQWTHQDIAMISDKEGHDRGDSNSNPYDLKDQVTTLQGYIALDVSHDLLGSFLVAPSEVPVPAAAWLFGSALIGLASIKRNR